MGNKTAATTNPRQRDDVRTSSYRAAVAEHRPEGDVVVRRPGGDQQPQPAMAMDVVGRNMKQYRSSAERAAKHDGAQIIVYPEWGLFGKSNPASSRETMAQFAQPVGEAGDDVLGRPKSSAAGTARDDDGDDEDGGNGDGDGRYDVVRELASIARDCGIVVVANVCEAVERTRTDAIDDDDGEVVKPKLYNTEVAISEDGILLAKYRKAHPWYTATFDTPDTPEAVTFRTGFGVTFGILICKDFYHAEPQRNLLRGGVTQIVYSVAAPDALGLVRWNYGMWARRNGATLLASNLGGAGSGIFAGGSDCGVTDVVRRDGYTVATVHL